MNRLTLAAVAACTVFIAGAFAQSAVVPIDDEPAARLIVEPPLPGPLSRGVAFIPYRVENFRVLTVNDLPWQWADYGQSNIILVGMPRREHKVLIELVDAEGNVFTGQTVTFSSPGKEARP